MKSITGGIDMIEVKEHIVSELIEGIKKMDGLNGSLKNLDSHIHVDEPKDGRYGDLSSNVAMKVASNLGKPPRKVAQEIVANCVFDPCLIEDVQIAGPGFINFFISRQYLHKSLPEIEEKDGEFGKSNIGKGERVQCEIVSANPTGPLHIGHGRGAAVGDAIARLLKAVGYDVQREYYINDTGSQMENLGRSVQIRYRQLLGEDVPFFEDGYQGDYIVDIAREIIREYGDGKKTEGLQFFIDYAYTKIMGWIRKDIEDFRISYDNWFSERSLHTEGKISQALDELRKNGYICESDGAVFFQSSEFGDDKDRVLIRQDGRPTYFAADIAYHKNKHERGFKKVINMWGADHHGYVPRMMAAVRAMGYSEDFLEIHLFAMVSLTRNGEPVVMSKRSWDFILLREVIDEVGVDACRYFFITKSSDSHLEFDLEVAKKQSDENPVYYVQYAHARTCSILHKAEEKGLRLMPASEVGLERLTEPGAIRLIKKLLSFPEAVASAAKGRKPHLVADYLGELAGSFHSFYKDHRVISEDEPLTLARLSLVNATRIVLRNALDLLGIDHPEKM